MLAIDVEFLHGVFRGDPDGTALTGQLTQGEWPPSPARLFAALVAADGTRQASHVTDGVELSWLERLPPPVIHAHAHPTHQKLEPRFVVAHGGSLRGTHQEYVARSVTLHRAGVRVTPKQPRVVYRWDAGTPSAKVFGSLRLRAARVGYLGASDSPVRVRVSTKMPSNPPDDIFLPDPQGDMSVNVPRPGDIDLLDRLYDAWRVRGASVTRSQFSTLTHPESYRSPGQLPAQDLGEVVAWLRIIPAVSGRRISHLTALFKEAVLSRHQRIHGEVPAVLHGHGFTASGYDLARYLALPDVGFPYSRGRIHGLALWLPPSTDDGSRRRARDAAFAIDGLVGNALNVAVEPREDEDRPWATNPRRWFGPSRTWVTAFPAIHERRGDPNLQEAGRWCEHAGFPKPVGFRSSRTPLAPGAVDLAPTEVNRPGRPALPYSHVALSFADRISGPVVVGAGRQRGFGLCIPIND